ncbi:MAG: hypothetical protein KDA22_03240 [Phycisphaerales bacterium]|nr:hypothetical protein [Phycisphaerales bacterium]
MRVSAFLVWLMLQAAGPASVPRPADQPTVGPPQRIGHVAQVVGSTLVVAGGIENVGGAKPLNRVDRLDLGTGQWSLGTPLPTPRVFAASAVLDGWIYVVGGLEANQLKGDACSAVVERYDPVRDLWERLPPMPTARSRFAACSLDGRLVTVGGLVSGPGGQANAAVVEALDPVERVWTRLPGLPVPIHAHAAAVFQGRMWVVGGFELDVEHNGALEASNKVYSLALEEPAWHREPDLRHPRGWCTALVDGGTLLVAGGARDESTEALTAGHDAWHDVAPDPEGRRFAAVLIDGSPVLVGGEGTDALLRRLEPMGWRRWSPAPPAAGSSEPALRSR